MAKRRAKARAPKPVPRIPKAVAPGSSRGETPHFCFLHADRVTKEEWVFKPVASDAPELFDFICEVGRLKWAELEAQLVPGKGGMHRRHHRQALADLPSKPRGDIKRMKLDELLGDEMYRFRLGKKKRLWGFRRERVFHVVWWDPKHKVYPTEKD